MIILVCLESEKEPIMILQDLASLLPSWNPGSWIGGFLLRDVRHDGLHEGVLGVVDDELVFDLLGRLGEDVLVMDDKLVLQVHEDVLGEDLLVEVVVDDDLIQLAIIAVVLDKLVLQVHVDEVSIQLGILEVVLDKQVLHVHIE